MPSHVRVVVRTRPTEFVSENFQILPKGTIHITRRVAGAVQQQQQQGHSRIATPSISGGGDVSSSVSDGNASSPHEKLAFTFDAVLNNASQETVYESTAADMVESVLQGFNCTYLCYGQRESGKTYTLFGGSAYPARGVVPRAIQSMFETMLTSVDREFKLSLTFVEVYGDQLYDLLGRGGPVGPVKPGMKNPNVTKTSVALNGNGDASLRGVEERQCTNEADTLAAMFEGLQRRVNNANANPRNSNSHLVLTFYVVSKSLVDSDALVHHSRCNFVDLAGIERSSAMMNDAAKQEAKIVNRSIMMLEQVMLALSGPRARHVPYRQSKLTMLLKDCIGGNSKTTLIANVWPEERHMESTLATLNFAKRMVRIESHPTVNASMDPEAHIKVLQKQVISLKSELRMQDQLAGREAISAAPLDNDEIQAAREQVMAFVDGLTPQVRVTSVREMHACFMVFKAIVGERDAQVKEMEQQLALSPRPGSGVSGRTSSKRQPSGKQQQSAAETRDQIKYMSSIEDPAAGVGVGTAEKPNPMLRNILFPRQPSVSNAAVVMQPGMRERSIDVHNNTTATTTTIPTFNRPPSLSRPTISTSIAPTTLGAVTMNNNNNNNNITTTTLPATIAISSFMPSAGHNINVSIEPTAPRCPNGSPGARADMMAFPAVETMKTQSYPRRPSTSPLLDKRDTNLPTVDHLRAPTGVPSLKSLGRQETVTRDKRTAFEAYKRTNAGVCQLGTINDSQRLLAEKNESIFHLQKRLSEIKASIEETKKTQPPVTATAEERVMARCTSIDADRLSMVYSESSYSVNENNLPAPEAPPVSAMENLSNMSLTEKKAFLNLTTNAITRAVMERGVLMKQLNRNYEAFMRNFMYWYESHLQSMLPVQRESVAPAAATRSSEAGTVMVAAGEGIDPIPSVRCDNLHSFCASRSMMRSEDDVRFMDTVERLETQELQRQVQNDPESATFYAAQRLMRKGVQSRD